MMKQIIIRFFISLLFLVVFDSCHKNDTFMPQGGQLPTNYITINDSSFSPASLKVADGSTITFLNSTHSYHTIMSDDSITFRSPAIAPDSFYIVKPDTATTIPVLIYIPYHCIEHPSARGTIVLTQ